MRRSINRTKRGRKMGNAREKTFVGNRDLTVGGSASSPRDQVAAVTATNKYGAHQVMSVHVAGPARDMYGVRREIRSAAPAMRKSAAIVRKKARMELDRKSVV